jgi:hypothetical protein
LINAGKKTDYSYMVSMNCTQLLFISIFRSWHYSAPVCLVSLSNAIASLRWGEFFGVLQVIVKFCSTQIRIGMQILYGLKQLHEVGYIHRDVKPANLAVGRKGPEARIVHLLDFGLAREYILRNEGKVEIRRPRKNTLFRGTTK